MSTPRYRQAGGADLPLVLAMVERCSDAALNARFNSGRVSPSMAASWLGRALDDRDTVSWVALVEGDVVAVASAFRQMREIEVALLVEDGWQRRGVGSHLLRSLVAAEPLRGAARLRATMAADRLPVARSLGRRLGVGLQCATSWGEAEVTADLGGSHAETRCVGDTRRGDTKATAS